MGKTITFYETADGKAPVRKFLDALPGKAAQKIAYVLMLIEEVDILPSTYFKKLTGTNLWECRIRFESNASRILCFMAGGSMVVLTNAFQKKTQKTPVREIELAENYRKDYLRRHPNHE